MTVSEKIKAVLSQQTENQTNEEGAKKEAFVSMLVRIEILENDVRTL